MAHNHIENLLDNLDEVIRLLEIHEKIAGTGPGYKHNVQILNKSAIVMLVATWEAFIEDLATASFEFLLKNADEPLIFPGKVLALAGAPLRANQNPLDIWTLCGDGWKEVLIQHRVRVLERFIGRFNTPRASQIGKLFEELVGMRKLPDQWKWRGMNAKLTRDKLSKLVKLRGQIAHRVSTSANVKKLHVVSITEFINRLAVISNNRVAVFLEDRTGENPWDHYEFGKTH